MIFTSYFAKLRNFPPDIVPISICVKAPYWYKGLQYKKLAPNYQILMEWKRRHNYNIYVRCFKHDVLSVLDADVVFEELSAMSGGKPFALICYERPSDFCHRHFVADWFQQNGYDCKEL